MACVPVRGDGRHKNRDDEQPLLDGSTELLGTSITHGSIDAGKEEGDQLGEDRVEARRGEDGEGQGHGVDDPVATTKRTRLHEV